MVLVHVQIIQSIKEAVHMVGALAFVPPKDVLRCFNIFLHAIPNDFWPVAQYFEVTYIQGKLARGWRRAVKVRFEPHLWNQYYAICQREAKTKSCRLQFTFLNHLVLFAFILDYLFLYFKFCLLRLPFCSF